MGEWLETIESCPTKGWNGQGELECPLRGQSLESRLAAQPSVLRAIGEASAVPLASGNRVYFDYAAPSAEKEEGLLGQVAARLAVEGFSASRSRRGSSGIELCIAVSRGTITASICCSLDETHSEVLIWHHPPWFWQRLFGRTATTEEIAEALRVICVVDPIDRDAEPIFLRGEAYPGTLYLQVGAPKGTWKRDIILKAEKSVLAQLKAVTDRASDERNRK